MTCVQVNVLATRVYDNSILKDYEKIEIIAELQNSAEDQPCRVGTGRKRHTKERE
jgi:hypothetical protein